MYYPLSSKIVVFGLGKQYLNNKILFDKMNIIGFSDNNRCLWNGYIDGIKIFNPKEINGLNFDYIIVSSIKYFNEIMKQLIDDGISISRIISLEKICDYFNFYEKKDRDRLNGFCNLNGYKIIMFSHMLVNSGATLALFQVALELKKRAYNVLILSPEDGKLSKKYQANNIDVIVDSRLSYSSYIPSIYVDNIDCLWINTVVYSRFLRKLPKDIKKILWLHEPEALYKDEHGNCIAKYKGEIDFNDIDIYSVSSVATESFHNIFGEKIDIKNFPPTISDFYRDKHDTKLPLRIISIGRFSELKGQDILMNTLALFSREEQEKFNVEIIGTEPLFMEKRFKNIIKKNNINNVFFKALMDRKEIMLEYHNSDVCIVSSRRETLSMVVIEAMMNCLICIVSEGAGISEYVQDGVNGFIYRNNSPKELADKIRYVIDNYGSLDYIRVNARKTYEDFFSEEALDKYISNYSYRLMISMD